MIKTFDQILEKVKSYPTKKIAVAVAQDEPVLEAVFEAKKMGIADAILVGDREKILECEKILGIPEDMFEIIDEKDNAKASLLAVELVSSKKAHMLMKGLVDTATFLRAVLDKERGLRTGKVLSHVAVFEVPALNRMLLLTDAAMNIAPDLKTKKEIIENAVVVAKSIGMEMPKVAVVAAVEVVNPDMQPTIDAAVLSKMNDRGQIKGCIIDGPLAIDNALSEEAAKHKGIKSPVAGHADIILVPNIETGNAMYKTLTYTSNAKNGGILSGAAAPVILTSRADSNESKLYSIALASLVAEVTK
ncbi:MULTISPECIES: phosphate butyryltransferase [Caloramator]|uniref:Phosphate butyryltransferase n=1 Tax=Caloramator australicus RC3 TaxID=857293 RepID=G0V3I2_9CLOT|nr:MULTISPECIES: phosphate butyryltransferase [Caloramator]MDO6353730.1 phosphate butyryltransferase [Caloramator sp. CAR-1]CCC57672.1 Phosphate butyryltransferase [Caloramator australicus RC3]